MFGNYKQGICIYLQTVQRLMSRSHHHMHFSDSSVCIHVEEPSKGLPIIDKSHMYETLFNYWSDSQTGKKGKISRYSFCSLHSGASADYFLAHHDMGTIFSSP